MKDLSDICVLVQARLGSQRIPQKMIKPFAGTTLMDIIIKKMKSSTFIPWKNFYSSVYEEELIDITKNHNANIFYRSEQSANSEGTPMTEMYEWWDKLPFKYCVLVNACAPFLKIGTIEGFVREYMHSSSDGMFGVMEKKNYFWDIDGNVLTPLTEAVMNTKTVPPTYEAAHCLYAGKMSKIGEDMWMGDFSRKGDIELFSLPEEQCLDIDYPWQFDMCEQLYKTGKDNVEKRN